MTRTRGDTRLDQKPPPVGIEFVWNRTIRDGDYMTRWGIRTRAFSIYLHRYQGADDDEVHNHPWKWWTSLVLRGELTETRTAEGHPPWRITRRPRDGFCRADGETYHKITAVKPGTLTLFIAGPWVRKWRFADQPDIPE